MRLSEDTADKQRKHVDITADSYCQLLPEMLLQSQGIVRQTVYQGRKTNSVVFLYERQGKFYWLVIRQPESDRELFLTSFHRAKEGNVKKGMKSGEVLRDRWKK